MKIRFIFALFTSIACLSTFAQGTAFTYQGRLSASGTNANGSYDLRFILYNSDIGGAQQGPILTNAAIAVSNGLFTVALDFGNVFDGNARWVEIHVRPAGSGSFTPLTPRQSLTPTPYAITAGSVNPSGIVGAYSGAVTFSNVSNKFGGSFYGDGGGLTNLGIGQASFTNASAQYLGVTTNDFAYLRTPSMAQAGDFPLPIKRFNTWYWKGPTITSNDIYYIIDMCYTNHLVELGWDTVMVTDAWQGGRTNGTLFPDPSKFENITNLVRYAHARGMKVGIYTEPTITTSAGYTGSGGYSAPVTNAYGKFTRAGDYIEDDAALFGSWGIDYVQFDCLTTREQALYYCQRFGKALRETEYAKEHPVHLYSSGWAVGQDTVIPYAGVVGTLNSFRVHTDPGGGTDGGSAWTNYVDFIERNQRALHWVPAGVFLDFEASGIAPDPYQSATKGECLYAVSAPMIISPAVPVLDDYRAMLFTNRTLLDIHRDPLGTKLSVVMSNANYWIAAKDLSGDRKRLAFFMNRKRDATAVATVTWPQLGYASNQYVRVFDAWSQTTVGTYSNAFTHTIPTNTADLFVFTPVSAIAVTQIVTYASCPIDNGTRSAFGGSYFDAVWLWASDPASMDVYVPVPTGFAHALMTTSFARSAADYSQVGIVTIYGDGSGDVVGENSQSVNFVSTGNTNFLATISTPLPSTTQNRFIRIRWPQGTNTLGIRQLQNSVKLVLTPAQ